MNSEHENECGECSPYPCVQPEWIHARRVHQSDVQTRFETWLVFGHLTRLDWPFHLVTLREATLISSYSKVILVIESSFLQTTGEEVTFEENSKLRVLDTA